jgi:hypothetical protein
VIASDSTCLRILSRLSIFFWLSQLKFSHELEYKLRATSIGSFGCGVLGVLELMLLLLDHY